MKNGNSEDLEAEVHKRAQKREKRKRSRMKVSGASVKRLGKIIKEKRKNND